MKTCDGCMANQGAINGVAGRCLFNYRTEHWTSPAGAKFLKPLERCPKPRTYKKFLEILELRSKS